MPYTDPPRLKSGSILVDVKFTNQNYVLNLATLMTSLIIRIILIN